jgi:type I restriction enzyme M protein
MEDIVKIASTLWSSADQLRSNSNLRSTEYSAPVLGLIFLRFADEKFQIIKKDLETNNKAVARMGISKDMFKAKGSLYLPEESTYSYLLNLPEGTSIGKTIDEAMLLIEKENEELKGVLPRGFSDLENEVLVTLLKTFSIDIPLEGDAFGKIYEYFLGKFALSEGQGGGEFFTPTSLVKLIVEVIEPYHGKIYDPACGSGGMFVQSANFVERHNKKAIEEVSMYGQEKTKETVRLGKMNLAIHGLSGDIREGNSYYEDIHDCIGKFDFVMANPPFNGKKVNFDKIKDDPRFRFGIPSSDNANYLWIQQFYNSLNDKGRAGFVMANSASDANYGELEIRKKMIKEGAVDVMVSISPNFFFNVTLPCSLWFFDKNKKDRKDKVLFIDARNIFRQIDRAHREFTDTHIEFISNIVRMYRGENLETTFGSDMKSQFSNGYQDILGLCKIATIEDIEEQGWSLNSGRYVGVAQNEEEEDFVFEERLEELNEELEILNLDAHKLEKEIGLNIEEILDKK